MLQERIVLGKPALFVEGQKKYLVVTDLHIGFESTLASNEIFIGKNTAIKETIEELSEIINSKKPDSLILLGDIKSSIKNISKTEWIDVPLFFDEIKEKCEVILIPGNHDANIQKLVPEGISLISSTGMVEEKTLFTHGHTMPSENFSAIEKIIMGHLHPVFFKEDSIVNGQRVWVTLRTDKENIFPSQSGEIEITIMPSFNRYFYATNKRKYKKSISPIVEKIKNVTTAKIITLDGTIIGNETILDHVI